MSSSVLKSTVSKIALLALNKAAKEKVWHRMLWEFEDLEEWAFSWAYPLKKGQKMYYAFEVSLGLKFSFTMKSFAFVDLKDYLFIHLDFGKVSWSVVSYEFAHINKKCEAEFISSYPRYGKPEYWESKLEKGLFTEKSAPMVEGLGKLVPFLRLDKKNMSFNLLDPFYKGTEVYDHGPFKGYKGLADGLGRFDYDITNIIWYWVKVKRKPYPKKR